MFPVLKQRLLVTAALVIAGLVWLLAVHPLSAVGGWSGLSLIDARASMPLAGVLVLLTGLPALVLALVAGSTGHPLSGIFVLAAALCFPAGVGGAIDGLFYRSQLPGIYLPLILEILIWTAGLIGFIAMVRHLRAPLRRRLGPLAVEGEMHEENHLALPNANALAGGLISAFIGGLLTIFIVQVSDIGQVIGGLIFAFLLASALAQTLAPHTNPILVLLSPALVAIVGYGLALGRYPSHEALIAAWHAQELIGIAMVLPIHYASAGLVGCTLGLGLADSIHRARHQHAEMLAAGS